MNTLKNKDLRFRRFVPNLVTIFGMCVGLLSLRAGIEGHYSLALYLIILAVFLDAADGKIARLLKAESHFGAELDTLSDFFNFGIVPTFLVYNVVFSGTEYASAGYLTVLAAAVCCALRLARFNVTLTDSKDVDYDDEYFVGVPAPALACLVLLPIFIWIEGFTLSTKYHYIIIVYLLSTSLLAVSTLPTFSIKHLKIPHQYQLIVLLISISLIVCLAIFPWRTMIVCDLAYLCSIPVAFWHFKRRHIKT